MKSRQKVLAAEAQIRSMMAGELSDFTCPFCDLVTKEGGMFCCDKAAEVIMAVLDHVEFKQNCNIVAQVLDQLHGEQSKVILN